MEQQLVREVLSITTQNLTKADKQVGARFNAVAMQALDQAERYLQYGPETSRLAITKSFLSAISRLSAADAEENIAIARASVMRMFGNITNVEPHLTNAETEAITVGTHDQDDG